jgi:hypothetical protein
MEPYDRVPLQGRLSAVSTSLLSTPGIDVDLHLVLARPLPDVLSAITFVRVSFPEERIAVDLFVSGRQVASDAAASELVAAQALALRRNPTACLEFVRRATAAATILCPN